MPWIYAPPFLRIWPIVKSTWLLWIDQSFLHCLFKPKGKTPSVSFRSWVFLWPFMHLFELFRGGTVVWVLELFDTQASTNEYSTVMSSKWLCLDHVGFRHSRNIRQNNVLTSSSDLEVFNLLFGLTPQRGTDFRNLMHGNILHCIIIRINQVQVAWRPFKDHVHSQLFEIVS